MKPTKPFLFFIAIILAVNFRIAGQALPIDADTKKITYREIVNQDGSPKNLFNRAILWINAFYINPSDVLRSRDTVNYKIEIKHRIDVWNVDKDSNRTTKAEIVEYSLALEFKEGRYRFTITDFSVKKTSKFPLERWMNKNDQEYSAVCDIYLKQVNEEINKIIKSLKEGMKPKAVKNSNW
jgi:hypothetical protein